LKKINESRNWLKIIGIDGEIIQIFGHGNQSIVLLLDDGKAFIGDLSIIYEYDELVKDDWDRIISKDVKYVYPAHSKNIKINDIVKARLLAQANGMGAIAEKDNKGARSGRATPRRGRIDSGAPAPAGPAMPEDQV
jgi:glyoxylase-like metal-dependent hydrolase (beta-lactamase superfamily II)